MSRMQPGTPWRSIAGMVAGRNDGNGCSKGIACFPRHSFQDAERQGWGNGGHGTAPCCLAGNNPRCMAGDANPMGLMASQATTEAEN